MSYSVKDNLLKNSDKLLIGLVVLIPICLLLWLFLPRSCTVTIKALEWESEVRVEKYKQVLHSDWYLPSNAELRYTRWEIRYYNHELDHYETHIDVYYDSDGNRHESEHREPVYKEVPVYDTKYYYYIWEWVYERSSKASGKDSKPYYEEPVLESDERVSSRQVKYYVQVLKEDKKNIERYSCKEEVWNELVTGTQVRIKLSPVGGISEFVWET